MKLKRIVDEMTHFGRLNPEDFPEVIVALQEFRKRREETALKEGYSPLPNGCTLYWRTNEMGNRIYTSDEIGGGVHVWDVTLVDPSTLLAALTKEAELNTRERAKKTKEK